MRIRILLSASASLLLAACQDSYDLPTGLAGPSPEPVEARLGQTSANALPGQYIVLFRNDVADVPGLARQLAAASGGEVGYTYDSAIKGFSLKVPEAAGERVAAALSRNPNVELVEADQVATHTEVQTNATWGIDRIDQRALPLNGSYSYNALGSGVSAYVIDSGILFSHVDFGGRAERGVDYVGDGRNGSDCNGHGTHVAGTIGGSTWGVAKGVRLVSVRVFGCTGGASYSTIIKAVDWVTANGVKPAVVNMSLGGGLSSTLNTAVTNSINAGFVYSISAGNSNADACKYSPASTPAAITVGSTMSNDGRSSFSNWGSCVDLFAPGSLITSAWTGSNTATKEISGTSMSAPHVAGVAALVLQNSPLSTPLAVRNAIVSGASQGVVTNSLTANNHLLYSLVAIGGGSTTLPSVTTAAISNIGTTTATTGGNVTDSGSATVTERGVCYGTASNPTTSGSCVAAGSGTGSFVANLTGLSPNVTYNVRAFATSTVGTAYGNQVTFTTASEPPPPSEGGFTLTAVGSKRKGQWVADLNWTGTNATHVNIRRGGTTIATVTNSGSYTDVTSFKGGGTLTYQVCESPGNTTCSNSVTVTF